MTLTQVFSITQSDPVVVTTLYSKEYGNPFYITFLITTPRRRRVRKCIANMHHIFMCSCMLETVVDPRWVRTMWPEDCFLSLSWCALLLVNTFSSC
ncbi:hypothetical protein UPYG_G00019780 [Umbra pygmaea]|uniref:Uncharacterized protein n=1 Tax=Umbra pygmaea TaxID=75934 RepID=A0ABD0XKK6_UMBPY